MARPYWSGQIQISLVQFGVKLFVATEAKSEIRFHQIDRSSGERVKHQKVLASAIESSPDEAAGQDAIVEKNQIVKGPLRHHRTRRARPPSRPLQARHGGHAVRRRVRHRPRVL